MSDDPKPVTFCFDITINETLAVEQIWPDGGAPENPTVDDVIKVLQECGGPQRVDEDWDLLNDIALDISGPGGSRTLVGPGMGRVINPFKPPVKP